MEYADREHSRQLEQQIIDELAAIALTRATDVVRITEEGLTLKRTKKGGGCYAAIAAVESTNSGLKVKLYDKLKALELLGEYYGLFGKADGKKGNDNNLLEAILSSTKEAINVSDLQELQQKADAGDDLVEQT